MNRTFKRVISSVLAFVMVMSYVMVMNVSTALADTLPPIISEFYLKDGTTPTFTGNIESTASLSSPVDSGTTYTGQLNDNTPISYAKGLKINGSNFNLSVTVTGTAKLEAYFTKRKDKTGDPTIVQVLDSNGEEKGSQQATSDSEIVTLEVNNLTTGTYTIKRKSGDEGAFMYMKVTDTLSESAKEFTLSGKCNVKSTNITIGDDETTTDSSGNWKITKIDNNGVSPWNEGDSLTAKCSQYKDATVSVSGSGTEFTTNEITFEAVDMQPLEIGKEYTGDDIGVGLPYFDIASLKNTDSSISVTSISSGSIRYNGNFTFMVENPAIITIKGKSAGSKDVTFKLTDNSGKVIKLNGADEGTAFGSKSTDPQAGDNKGKEVDFVTEVLPAGTYKLTAPLVDGGSDHIISKISVAAGNEIKGVAHGDQYVVFGISAENAAKYNSYKIVGGEAESGTTVYQGVNFGNEEKTASELVGTDYCVAYKFDDVAGNLADLVSKVKLSLEE